jgi:DNA repair exonuclease SbcCD ATPase subunit
MQIISLEISNILSIESASIKFENSGLVLVEGWNHDTNRANGAGKTAIFNCLSFALFDKIPRKITASEILRRGAKSGCATVSLLCGKDEWTVRRSRPKGVEFFKNGNKSEITQDEFESKIRFTYDQFLLTVYTPQANSFQYLRFISSPDSEKKSFILRLLNLDRFADLKKATDDRLKLISSQIERDVSSINANSSKISAYSESLVDEIEINEQLSLLNSSISSLEDQLSSILTVEKPDLSKYKKLELDLRQKQTNISQAKVRRSMLHDRYREMSLSVKELNVNEKCNECGSILDTKQSKLKHEEHQTKIKEKLKQIKSDIDQQDLIVSDENKISDLLNKLEEKKRKDSEQYNKNNENLNEIRTILKVQLSKKDNLLLKIKNNQELKNKIESLNELNEKITEGIFNNKKNLEVYKTLSNIYSPTGAQAYVLDSVVDTFNEVIQKYLDILSPNMSYVLNSYKETSKGDVVAKFSETLSKNGTEVSVGSLSGGELKGLSLCVDFALLEVLETQFGLNLNPIILDEPFDGLDTSGREIVLALLEQLSGSRQIFVIDHASEAKASFSKVIQVELRNNISTISINT